MLLERDVELAVLGRLLEGVRGGEGAVMMSPLLEVPVFAVPARFDARKPSPQRNQGFPYPGPSRM